MWVVNLTVIKPINNIRVYSEADKTYSEMYHLEESVQYDTGFDLDVKRDQELSINANESYYFKIQIPDGVKGVCTGVLQFTAYGPSGGGSS